MSSLWLKIRDLTFPIVSYVKGTQFNRMLVRMLGETAWSTLVRESLLIGGWVACAA